LLQQVSSHWTAGVLRTTWIYQTYLHIFSIPFCNERSVTNYCITRTEEEEEGNMGAGRDSASWLLHFGETSTSQWGVPKPLAYLLSNGVHTLLKKKRKEA
jgi:hypothetical protein